MDKAVFYNVVRDRLFSGRLSQEQVDGMEAILNFWEDPPIQPTGAFLEQWQRRTIGWLAYMLATTYHETAFTMQPISEYGDIDYFRQLYCDREDLGNGPAYGGEIDDGPRFKGRGYVQITGRINYTAMTAIVREFYPESPDFTVDPEAVKDPRYAAVIMFYGMFLGTFTGWALADYLGKTPDYRKARNIINPGDRAKEIAAYAEIFEEALAKAKAIA
jgi:hypothetical protein